MVGYCPHCGIREEKGEKICPHCKQAYSMEKSMKGVPALGAAGIGWTPYAKDPSLKHYQKKTKKGMRIGMAIVSIIIAAVIMISSHMDFDDLMNGGYVTVLGPLAIIWVFWFIWMTLNFKKTKGWEGEVINKDCKTYENKNRDEDGNVTKSYSTYYNIYFHKALNRYYAGLMLRNTTFRRPYIIRLITPVTSSTRTILTGSITLPPSEKRATNILSKQPYLSSRS